MKWFVFMFAAIAATLMVTPEANSGSFDPVTGAYTTDPITVTLTPKTVAVSTSVIANGERVYWATDKYPQGAGTFYWGSHTYLKMPCATRMMPICPARGASFVKSVVISTRAR